MKKRKLTKEEKRMIHDFFIAYKKAYPMDFKPDIQFTETIFKQFMQLYFPNTYCWLTSFDFQLSYVHGVGRLGYDERRFNIVDAIEMICLPYRKFVIEYGLTMYKILEQTRTERIREGFYKIPFVIQDRKGNFYHVTQVSRGIFNEKSGVLIGNFNTYYFTGYQGEEVICRPEILDFHNNRHFEIEETRLLQTAGPEIAKQLALYTPFQKRILKLHLKYENNLEVAKKMYPTEKIILAENRIKQHNKSILRRTRNLFPQTFRTAKDVAIYYFKLGLLQAQ